MMEVHTGARPGRPRLLLVLTALAFGGTVALAWFQVQQARRLGPGQPIADTPLRVRLPRGWVRDPENPQRFILPHRDHGAPRDPREPSEDRWIRFSYVRLPEFRQPVEVLRGDRWLEAAQPARVGPFDGVQAIRRVPHPRIRGFAQERVMRLACSPRGDLIQVEYLPLTEFTESQRLLLDEICGSLEINDAEARLAHADAFARAGVSFPLAPQQPVCGALRPELPGFYAGYSTPDAAPLCAIGAFRTFLGPGRTPRDLLIDLARTAWLAGSPAVRSDTRSDGAAVLHVRNPDTSDDRHPLSSAWAVAAPDGSAALLLVYAGALDAQTADQVAGQAAQRLEFTPARALPNLDDAAAAGRELAGLLTREGPVAWWGREPLLTYFLGSTATRRIALRSEIRALGREPRRGYEGSDRFQFEGPGEQKEVWSLDGRGAAYTSVFDGLIGGRGGRMVIVQDERPAGGTVRRVVQAGRAREELRFVPGEAFVAPPLEFLAAALAAQSLRRPCLFESTQPFARATCGVLAVPLAEEGGLSRVLLLRDYLPTGSELSFDADAALHALRTPELRLERARPAEVERLFPGLR